MLGMQQKRYNGNLYFDNEQFGLINPMFRTYPALKIAQDPGFAHVYWEDFHTYTTGHWDITTIETGAASATEVLTDGAGGLLLVTTDSTIENATQHQLGLQGATVEAFKLVLGKPLWFETRAALSDALDTEFAIGVCSSNTTQIAAGDSGIFFQKDPDDRNIDYHCELATADTTGDTGVDLIADVYYKLGLYYNGDDTVEYWIDNELRATAETNIPTEEITPIFALRASEAVAKAMTVDYVFCAQIR